MNKKSMSIDFFNNIALKNIPIMTPQTILGNTININLPKQTTKKKMKKEKKPAQDKKIEKDSTSNESTSKANKNTSKNNLFEVIEQLTTSEKECECIDTYIETKSRKNEEAQAYIQQYNQMLENYKLFLKEYLKEYYNAANDNFNMQENNYPFERGVEVPKRKFESGQEVMTYTEIRDIVRRKRMNWAMGAEHNYVSPDEKERYKFWKLFNKFNYVMAEGCMFNL